MKLLTWYKNFSFSCVLLGMLFYSIHVFIESIFISPSSNALVQPWVLLLTAKYNYFEMSSGTLFGAAFGYHFKQAIIAEKSVAPYVYAGISLVIFSLILAFEMGDIRRIMIWPKGLDLWTWPLYLGLVIVTVSFFYVYSTTWKIQKWAAISSNIVALIGILAFPVFFGHELVRPLAELGYAFGVPLALPISLLLFLGVIGYMVFRLHRIYFGKTMPGRVDF